MPCFKTLSSYIILKPNWDRTDKDDNEGISEQER